MIFTAGGLVFAQCFPAVFAKAADQEYVHLLAELTLILVLFSDAAAIKLSVLKNDHHLPVRMLAIGLPLTVLLGAVLAFYLFGVFTIWEAALLAAILAPTDAALGQSVVTSKIVPLRIRQAISVESGLNDGIGLPLVVIFATLAAMSGANANSSELLQFSILQVTMGPFVGIAIGFIGAKLIDYAVNKEYIAGSFEGIAALCVAVAAFALAESIHGNGFIAAFLAGLTFGNVLSHKCKFLYEFAESEGQFFTLSTFLIFGMISLELIGESFHWTYVLYAALSLTIIRMLPIALSLVGTGTEAATKGFLGWFGPRGLASILFALLIIEKESIAGGRQIVSIVVVTVLMSVLLHGVTASSFSNLYGAFIAKKGTCIESAPVIEAVVEMEE
jgi:NhaP-type Na+/H+ or K+/H+ antiporter